MLNCDWKACPKVYHLACLGRQKRPGEVWYCPWHHCVQCGKTAVSHCIHCPNAYCKAHNSILKKHKELGSICDEHKGDITDLVLFYRAVGGIKHLVPNPSVPLTEVRPHLLTSGSDETGNEKDSNAAKQTKISTPVASKQQKISKNSAPIVMSRGQVAGATWVRGIEKTRRSGRSLSGRVIKPKKFENEKKTQKPKKKKIAGLKTVK